MQGFINTVNSLTTIHKQNPNQQCAKTLSL